MKIEFIAIKTPVITSTAKELSKIILNAFKSNNIEIQDYDIIIIEGQQRNQETNCQRQQPNNYEQPDGNDSGHSGPSPNKTR